TAKLDRDLSSSCLDLTKSSGEMAHTTVSSPSPPLQPHRLPKTHPHLLPPRLLASRPLDCDRRRLFLVLPPSHRLNLTALDRVVTRDHSLRGWLLSSQAPLESLLRNHQVSIRVTANLANYLSSSCLDLTKSSGEMAHTTVSSPSPPNQPHRLPKTPHPPLLPRLLPSKPVEAVVGRDFSFIASSQRYVTLITRLPQSSRLSNQLLLPQSFLSFFLSSGIPMSLFVGSLCETSPTGRRTKCCAPAENKGCGKLSLSNINRAPGLRKHLCDLLRNHLVSLRLTTNLATYPSLSCLDPTKSSGEMAHTTVSSLSPPHQPNPLPKTPPHPLLPRTLPSEPLNSDRGMVCGFHPLDYPHRLGSSQAPLDFLLRNHQVSLRLTTNLATYRLSSCLDPTKSSGEMAHTTVSSPSPPNQPHPLPKTPHPPLLSRLLPSEPLDWDRGMGLFFFILRKVQHISPRDAPSSSSYTFFFLM
ncbi:hypothetical protein MJO28_017239, partial [Puccinia striiformis f. sp. tritici]